MFILSFYLFLIGYAILFQWLFPVGLTEITDYRWYLFGLISVLLALLLSFVTQLMILKEVG